METLPDPASYRCRIPGVAQAEPGSMGDCDRQAIAAVHAGFRRKTRARHSGTARTETASQDAIRRLSRGLLAPRLARSDTQQQDGRRAKEALAGPGCPGRRRL